MILVQRTCFFLDVEGINKKGEQDYNSQIYGVSIRCSLYEYPRSSHDFPISSLMIPIIPFFFTVTMNPHIFNGEVPILPKKDANKKVPTLEKGTHPFPIPFRPFGSRKTVVFRPPGPGLRHYHWTPTSRLGSTTCRDIEWPSWSGHPLAGWYTSHEEKICQNREQI